MLVGMEKTRHLDTKLLPLSMEELDMSMLNILRNLGLARSLVLGTHSGIPSRSSKVDWRENNVVACVEALRDGGATDVAVSAGTSIMLADAQAAAPLEIAQRFNDDAQNNSRAALKYGGELFPCNVIKNAQLSGIRTHHPLTVKNISLCSPLKPFENQLAVTLKPSYRICLSFIEQDRV